MASVAKKRRIEAKKGNAPSLAVKDNAAASSTGSPIPTAPARVQLQIQQAKKFAVTQAQQEGCLGNYRSFDSPFGNYLVPVIPTRTDLFGRHPTNYDSFHLSRHNVKCAVCSNFGSTFARITGPACLGHDCVVLGQRCIWPPPDLAATLRWITFAEPFRKFKIRRPYKC
ncbi:hypothetical protein MUK42_03902 [Musa troglodytarum]|uniref:Uncharacterized protein n=2 Tax=Musa troglodytarum TaxID=320322 RepID=A0A9E7GHT8_9LILI|nr:hypothetical protein MUK42_03902 [Musa troglodytarum]